MTWCIEITIYIIFVSIFIFRFLNAERQENSFLSVLDSLSTLRIQLILGNAKSLIANSQGEEFIFHLIRECYFQGRSLNGACEQLSQQILKDEEYRLGKQRMLSLIMMRILLVLGVSIFARAYLNMYFDMKSADLVHLISLLLSFACALMFFGVVNHFYPKSWFLTDNIESDGREWLRALFIGECKASSPIYNSWKNLEDHEKTAGVSLSSTKALLIATWRSKKEMELEKRLQIFEDYIPALEFLCLSVSSFLILGGPIFELVGF